MPENSLKKLEFGQKVWIKNAGEAIFLRFLPHLRPNPVICLKWVNPQSGYGESAVILAVKPHLISESEESSHDLRIVQMLRESTQILTGQIVILETIKFK